MNDREAQETKPGRCYRCFRPADECFCDTIPSIDNRTDVLILQHIRERFHPFNTARIVHLALKHSTLLVDETEPLAEIELPLKPQAGLLYPGPDAKLLSDLAPEERPDQLVILDGTWHHVKTLFRDLPVLKTLPCYRLSPETPGRYRIRREPNTTSLSTIEATVAALTALEPETVGLEQLTQAFDRMIEQQLTHHKAPTGWRQNRRRNRTVMNVPRAIAKDFANLIVAYGESTPGGRGRKRASCRPVYWVAERLGTGERFSSTIQTDAPLDRSFLGHLELTANDFANAASSEQFCEAWSDFLRPMDTLVVYHPNTIRLLRTIGATIPPCVFLKSIDFESTDRHYTSLEEILEAKHLTSPTPTHPGRAGRRLADAIALVRYLNELS
ncbi:MAG: tRNA-uridine aminocarboxypropyltransferase [Planctomycetia bacterium]